MSTLESIQKAIAPELERLNERIRKQLGASNTLMETIVATYLRTKGKQLRPIIVILTAKMMGADVDERVLAAGAAVELLHNASLIHDDVVDNSSLRRGQPTVNAIWDNHIAVLVGDFFVSSAMQQAISTADIRIIQALCGLGKNLSLGELDQIHNARDHSLTEDTYFRIIDYKTASLFVACAQMGCYAAGASDGDADSMAEFARLLGLSFQIRDDIFDYFSDDSIGKPTGNDLREGKVTLPLLHALLKPDAPQAHEMKRLSQKADLSDQEIATLTRFAIDNGGIEYAFGRMAQLRSQARLIMDRYPQSEAKTALLNIFDSIVNP